MVISLSDHQARLVRLRSQRLLQLSDKSGNVTQVVKDICGIQAQEIAAATLAVRVRSSDLLAADVEYARVQERSVIRTWGMRGTLHLLATEDSGWLLPLLGPIFIKGDQRRRAELGLDEDTCTRAIAIICNVLANSQPLTRAELVEQLAVHGIHLEGQARPHLLYQAALEGVICFGPDRGNEPTYVLLSEWIAQENMNHHMPESEAYAELTRRYLNAYGPATPQDQAAWSGLPLSKIRAAWQHMTDQIIEVEIAGSPAWMLKSCAGWLDGLDELSASNPAPIVRLLPRYDIYVLGYQNRNLAVPPAYAKRVNAGGGIVHPTVLVDGQVVGIWKIERKKNHMDVLVEPFEQLVPEIHAGLEAEVADLARFLDVQANLRIMNSL